MQYSVENRDIYFFSFPLCVQGQVLFVPLKDINPGNVVINAPVTDNVRRGNVRAVANLE